jgi:hypothetical protein
LLAVRSYVFQGPKTKGTAYVVSCLLSLSLSLLELR